MWGRLASLLFFAAHRAERSGPWLGQETGHNDIACGSVRIAATTKGPHCLDSQDKGFHGLAEEKMIANGSKYALDVSITKDSIAITIDGQAVGPGPAHYGTLREAFRGAAAWTWIYAEASLRTGRRSANRGHGYEWDTLLFQAGSKYGFLTPQINGDRHAEGPNAIYMAHRKTHALKGASVVGYLHSHPADPKAAFDTVGEQLSSIDLDGASVVGDLGVALANPRWWIGVLTPQAKVYRARVRSAMLQQLGSNFVSGSNMPVTPELRKFVRQHRDRLFDFKEDQPAKGQNWKPFAADFREKCIAEAINDLN
jgi:hypothetical protein